MSFVNVTGFYKHQNEHGQKFVPRQKKKRVETTVTELVLTQKPRIENSAQQALTWFLQNIKNHSPCGKGFTKNRVTELPILNSTSSAAELKGESFVAKNRGNITTLSLNSFIGSDKNRMIFVSYT